MIVKAAAAASLLCERRSRQLQLQQMMKKKKTSDDGVGHRVGGFVVEVGMVVGTDILVFFSTTSLDVCRGW